MSYSLSVAAVTNYHKLNSLLQHSFVSSQFCQSEVQHGMAEFSAHDLTGLKPRYQQGCILIWGSGFFSKPTDFCQNSFFLLLSMHHLPEGPEQQRVENSTSNFRTFYSTTSLPLTLLPSSSLFKGSSDYSGSFQIIQNNLLI